jgi:HEAT repeat protein
MLPLLFRLLRKTSKEEIEQLRSEGNYSELALLLNHREPAVQEMAVVALASCGPAATPALIQCLDMPSVIARIGALEALARSKDPGCTVAVIQTLEHDPDPEVRWAAAITLGQAGDQRGIGPLTGCLTNPDKYIRLGAAKSLDTLGWKPERPEQDAARSIALQDWASVRAAGRPALPLLVAALSDPDRVVRGHAIEILGAMRYPEAAQACDKALGDADGRVRWKAVLTAKKCGVPMIDLPLFVSRRPRNLPNPYAAAVLNLFFIGLGYNYLGKWWGFIIFMSYMTLMLLISLEISSDLPFFTAYPSLYSYPVTAIFAIQTFYMAKKVPEL